MTKYEAWFTLVFISGHLFKERIQIRWVATNT